MTKLKNPKNNPAEKPEENIEESSAEHQLQNKELITLMHPIITLLNLQEERLARKIDQQETRMLEKIEELHDDIIETRDEFKAMNGSLRATKEKVLVMESNCGAREKTCAAAVENAKSTKNVVAFINEISRRPRMYLVAFLGLLIVSQTVVLKAVTGNWLDKIWSYVRLIL